MSPGASAPAVTPRLVLGALGAAGMVVSAFLNWQDIADQPAKGTKVPIEFLVDYKTVAGSPSILLLLAIAAGLVGVGLATQRRFSVFGGGALGVVVVVLFAIQVQRLLDAADSDFDLTDFFGIGVYVALVGGIAAIAASLIPDPGASGGETAASPTPEEPAA